ncbi:30S ribosomal protein S8 [Candidatus Woesearchaeota archaeon]|nr:30S ribosomal protein S8 [Candidatus Woesearchaeota archaeon]
MAMNDTLASVLSNLNNCEKIGKKECVVKPSSKIIKSVFEIMKDKGYIGDFKVVEDGRGNAIEVSLLGRINKCGVIKPRFSFKKGDIEKYEKRYLPARDFGIIIVSTQKGFMTHSESKEKSIGGRLISYVY